jgi:hypothetical protein
MQKIIFSVILFFLVINTYVAKATPEDSIDTAQKFDPVNPLIKDPGSSLQSGYDIT